MPPLIGCLRQTVQQICYAFIPGRLAPPFAIWGCVMPWWQGIHFIWLVRIDQGRPQRGSCMPRVRLAQDAFTKQRKTQAVFTQAVISVATLLLTWCKTWLLLKLPPEMRLVKLATPDTTTFLADNLMPHHLYCSGYYIESLLLSGSFVSDALSPSLLLRSVK
jgi:hypothetical protein